MAQHIEIRELICELAEHEIVERSIEQNTLMREVTRLEANRRDINAAIKDKEERVDDLTGIILSGVEHRDVECYWRYEWDIRIKFLHRSDNDALIEQQPIREHEKQFDLFGQTGKPVDSKPLFEPCPASPCVMVKNGAVCSPAFCGKNPPAATETTPLVKISASNCDHPLSVRFQDSNCLLCEACGTVLETYATDPVSLIAEEPEEGVTVCGNTICKLYNQDSPNGCGQFEHAWECGESIGEVVSVSESTEDETQEDLTSTDLTEEEVARRTGICAEWSDCVHQGICFTPQNEEDGICFKDEPHRLPKVIDQKAVNRLVHTSADDCKTSLNFENNMDVLHAALEECTTSNQKTKVKHISARINQLAKEQEKQQEKPAQDLVAVLAESNSKCFNLGYPSNDGTIADRCSTNPGGRNVADCTRFMSRLSASINRPEVLSL